MECAGRMLNDSVMDTVVAPGTQTFSMRVGFCPLFEGKKAVYSHMFTNAEKGEICFSYLLPQKIANAPAQPPLPALTLATNLTKAMNILLPRHSTTPRGQWSVAADC